MGTIKLLIRYTEAPRLAALYQRFSITSAADVAWANARALQPQDYRWPYYQGWLALETGRIEPALAAFSEAGRLTPDYAPLAQAYRGLGRRDDAREQLARFKPGEPPADDPLVMQLPQVITHADEFFNAAMRAVKQHDYTEANRQFERGLVIEPDNDHARTSYGRALYLAGRSDEAGGQFRQVLEHDPKQALAAFMLALWLDESGQHEQAVKHYRQVLSLQVAHPGAHYFLANRLFLDGHYRQAAEHYQTALDADVDLPPARLLRLIALHHAGVDDRRLAADLRALISSHPGQVEFQYALVRLLALSRDEEVHDDIAAIKLANHLAQAQASPDRLQVPALAAAANGQFPVAAGIIEQAQAIPDWGRVPRPPGLARDLAAYRRGVIPEQDIWPLDDPLLSPPPLDPTPPFREYLSPTPF